jgi:signal transduction histidine kinase
MKRHFRKRLILLTLCAVFISSTLATWISTLIANVIFSALKPVDFLVITLTAREILSPILTVCVASFFISLSSRHIASPLEQLSRATREIAAGNFAFRLHSIHRKDEFGRLASDFNAMAKQLQANEYLRKDFVSSVSHEFKTPLSVIKGYAQLLESNRLTDEERREYARTIYTETDRLLTLSSTLLKLSKLENDQIPEAPTAFSLDEQIRQVVLQLESEWNKKQIAMDVDLQEVTYTGNEELLQQVWINLLQNAIKFSNPSGSVYVRLYVKEKEAVVEVSDSGIGMTPETMARIFEQFYQGDHSHRQEGNGLGLALVKKALDMHGASIDVKSKPGEGSVFTVHLPT